MPHCLWTYPWAIMLIVFLFVFVVENKDASSVAAVAVAVEPVADNGGRSMGFWF